jgi:hypothetical protein
MNDEERLKAAWKREILDPVERLDGRLDALDNASANDFQSVREQFANLARFVSHLDETVPPLDAEITRFKSRLDAIEANDFREYAVGMLLFDTSGPCARRGASGSFLGD